MALGTGVGIKLSQVITEIGGGITKLSQAFSNSNPSGFNGNYSGTYDRLSNFRGYNHSASSTFTVYWNHNQTVSDAGSYFGAYGSTAGSYLYGVGSDYGQFDVNEGASVDMFISEYNVSPTLHVYAVSQSSGYITGAHDYGISQYVYDEFTMPNSNVDIYGNVY